MQPAPNEGHRARRPFLHMPIPWVFVVAYLAGFGVQLLVPVGVSSSALSLVLQVAGGVVFVAGVMIAGWSLIMFHRARTTTTPGEASATLVTNGPYRFTRNPMYLGLVLAYLGEEGLLLQIWPLAFLVLAIAYVERYVIPVEEMTLRVFGETYRQYCAEVGRWI